MSLRRIDLKIAVPSGDDGHRLVQALEMIHAAARDRRVDFRLVLSPQGPVVYLPLPAKEDMEVRLRPSGRFEYPCWKGEPGRRLVYYSGSQECEANLVGAKLMRGKSDDPRCWRCRLVLEVASPIGNASCNQSSLLRTLPIHPSLRVMSAVILNDGTVADVPFAACSVFKVVEGRPTSVLALPADASRDLWAQQERLFFLSMPTERGRFSFPRPAELIAQEALGNKYGARRGWFKRQAACQAILLGAWDEKERRIANSARREARALGLSAGRRLLRQREDLKPFDQAHILQRLFWASRFDRS